METLDYNHDSVDTILSTKQFEEISECLSNLAFKLRITSVLLVDSAGQVISQNMQTSKKLDSTLISTLTANSYAAAKEMAKILGEDSNFKMVLHEGTVHNIFVASANRDYFLVVIFETGVALGMVRLFMKKTIAQLLPVLSRIEDPEIKMNQVFDQRFQSLLGEELDRSFKDL